MVQWPDRDAVQVIKDILSLKIHGIYQILPLYGEPGKRNIVFRKENSL